MSGIIIDIDTNAESAKKDLQTINKGLASLINASRQSGKNLGSINSDSFKDLNYKVRGADDTLRRIQQSTKSTSTNMRETAATATMLAGAMDTVKTAAIALGSSFLAIKGVSAFNKVADDLTNIQNRLKLVIKDSDTLFVQQRKLYDISKDTRTSFASTVGTYTDFSASIESAGISASRLNGVMSTLNKGIALSGSTVEGVQGALLQLGQGIGSGTLRGEELNSVLEQMKYVGQGLTRTLGMTTGQLRDFASDGKLTTEVLIGALEKMADRTNKDFGDTTATAGQAVEQLSSAVSYFFAQINQKAGITDRFSKRIIGISDIFSKGADEIFAKSYLLKQSIKNFFTDIDKSDASDLVVRGVLDLQIDPLDAYSKYKIYKEIKSRVESVKKFFGTQPTMELQTSVKTNGLFDSFTADSTDIEQVGKRVTQVQGVMENLKRLGSAFGDSLVITFQNLSRLGPRVLGPVIQSFDSFAYSIKAARADLNASIYDAVIPYGRALESINQRLSLFAKGDNKLERAWVDLFKSDSLVAFTANLENLNDVRKKLRYDDKSFLGRELGRNIRSAGYSLQTMLIELGVLDNQLIRIRDTRLDRLAMYFSNIGRVVTRLYQDVFATTFEPIALKIFYGLELAVRTFFDAVSTTFNATTGAKLADAFVNAFVNASEAIFKFWDKFDKGSVGVTDLFGPSFVSFVSNTIGSAVDNIGQFIKVFFRTLGNAVAAGISGSVFETAYNAVTDVVKRIVSYASSALGSLQNTLKGATKNFSLDKLFAFDRQSFVAALQFIVEMFREVLAKTGDLASKVLVKVKDFAVKVKDEFFEIYDEVVGHSFWPDLIDEVNDYTDKLLTSENRISRFATTIKGLFGKAYDTLTQMGIGAGGTIAEFTVRIKKIDLGNALENLRDNIVGIITAGFLFAFAPNARWKIAAVSYFLGLFNNTLGGAFSVFSEQLGKVAGEATAILAASVVKGIVSGFSLALDAIPAFAKSFVAQLTPSSEILVQAFNFVPLLSNTLVGSIAAAAAAWALFSKSGKKTISEIIFGKTDKKGNKTDGITDYLKAMFPALEGTTNKFIDTLFPQKKLAIAGGLALSSAMLESVSIFQAAQVGLPLLAFAMLGKNNGAGLARSVGFVWEGIIKSVLDSARSLILKNTTPGGFINELFTTDPNSASNKKKSAIKAQIYDMYLTALKFAQTMRANADQFGAGKIGFYELFTKDFDPHLVGPRIEAQIPNLKQILSNAITKVMNISLPSGLGGGTVGALVAGISMGIVNALATAKTALNSFKSVLVAVFTNGWNVILKSIALLGDGLRAVFSVFTNKFVLFAALAAGLSGAAFAAGDASSAFGVVAENGAGIVSTIGKIVASLAVLGVAYRTFVAYAESKSLLQSVRAGTFVNTTQSEALEKFKQAQAVASEATTAKAVEAERKRLAKIATQAERLEVFASEADRYSFRKAARERNEKLLAAFAAKTAADNAKTALGGLDAFEANYKRSQERIAKISSAKTDIGAGLLGAQYYLSDMFTNGLKALNNFRKGMSSTSSEGQSIWGKFAEKVGGLITGVFNVNAATFAPLLAGIARIQLAMSALTKGQIFTGISNLFGGLGNVIGGLGKITAAVFAGIAANIGSLGGLIKAASAGFASLGRVIMAALAPLVALLAPVAGIVAIVAGAISVVGVLALWLFGPGNSFIDNLEWAYDKIKSIFGLSATTNGGRKAELNKLIGGSQKIGDQTVDFSKQLRGIDYGKLSDTQYKVAEDTSKETKEALQNLNELFVKQGKFTEENLKELDNIRSEQANILLRLPQKEGESFKDDTKGFNNDIVTIETSFFDMLRNLVGWKPVLRETVQEISGFQRGVTALFDAFTSWPAIIGGAIGIVAGPAGIAIGATIGALVATAYDYLKDGVKRLFTAVSDAITETDTYKTVAHAADTAVSYIEGGFARVGDAFVDLGNSVSDTYDKFIDGLKNRPNDLETGIQARFKAANGELPQYSTALSSPDQSTLQASFDAASDAAKKYASLMREGFRGTNAKDLADFTKQLDDASAAFEKTMKDYESVTARLGPLAKALSLTKQITTEQKNLFDSTKTLFDYDFGKDGKEFIGNREDLDEIGGYIDVVKDLQNQLKTTYDLSERRKITLDIETAKQQLVALGDYIKGSGFLNQDVEIKAKLTGDFASADTLKSIFFKSPEAYKALDGLSKEYTATMADINAITVDTPIETVQALITKVSELRQEAIKTLPANNIFSQINASITALGGKALPTNVFASLDPTKLKSLSDAAQKINLVKVQLDELEKKGAEPSAQVAKLKELDTATKSYLGTVDQFNADALKDIVTDKSLGNATKAYSIAKQLGSEIPEGVAASSSAMGRWAQIQVEMARTQIELNRLIQEGGSDSETQIAALGTKMALLNREISNMSSFNVVGIDTVISKLQDTGIAINNIQFSRLAFGAQKSLTSIGVQIEALDKRLSDASATGLAGAPLKKIMDQRQALLVKAREQMLDATYVTGDGITEALNNIGVSDLTQISKLATERVQELLGVDRSLKQAKFKLADATDLTSYMAAVKQVAVLEKQAARASEDASASFSTRAASINEVFGTSLSDTALAGFDSKLFSDLSTYATKLKRDMEDAIANGVTSAGESISTVFDKLADATRTGEYLTFFADFEKNTRDALTNGAQTAFDKISSMIPDFAISFDSLAELPEELRRAFDKQASDLEAYKKVINLPGLSGEMADLLNQTDKPISDLLTEFRTQFGAQFDDAFKTNADKQVELLASIDATLKGKPISVELPATEVQSTDLSSKGSSSDGQLSAAALQRATKSATLFGSQVGDAVIAAQKTIRGKLEATSAAAGSKFDTTALNLASGDQLQEALSLATQLNDRKKALNDAINAGLPTQGLQKEVLLLQDSFTDIQQAINDGALKAREAGKSFASSVTSDFNTAFADLLKGKSDDGKGVIGTFLSTVVDNISGSIIDTFTAGLLDPLTGDNGIITKSLKEVGTNLFNTAGGLFGGLFGGASTGSEAAASGVAGLSGAVGSNASGLLGGAADVAGMCSCGDTITKGVSGAVAAGTSAQQGFFESLGDRFSTAFESLGETLGKAWQTLSSSLGGLFSGGGGGGSSWFGTALSVIGTAVGGYFSGGSSAAASSMSQGASSSGYTGSAYADWLKTAGHATGGLLKGAGTGTSDSIMSRLSNGEFIVNAKSTKANLGLLMAINTGNMGNLPAFASGGLVSTSMVQTPTQVQVDPVASRNGGGNTSTNNIYITGDISRQTKTEIFKMLPQIATGVNAHNKEKNIK